MNKKLFLGMFAAAGMLLATSCSNDELSAVQSGNEAQVTFSLGLENGIGSRAISDGKTANKLVYAVYNSDGNALPVFDGEVYQKEESIGDITSTPHEVKITLAKGQTYQVAFWAQNSECGAYGTSDLKNVTVSYDGLNNDENRDAFFKTVEFKVEGDKTIDVVLKRPFAQINVGVTQEDWDAAVASGIEIEMSKVVIDNAATSINLLTGVVDGKETVTYALKEIPKETLEVDSDGDGFKEEYNWLSMSYILVNDTYDVDEDNDGTLGDYRATLNSLQFTFKPLSGNKIEFKEGLNTVPVQRNWRTNILGKILTGDIQFNITIDPAYDGDIIYPDGSLEQELEMAATFGGTVTLAEDVTLTAPLNVGADMILNMGDNVTLTGSINVAEGATLAVNGGAIQNGNSAVSGITSVGDLTLNDVTIESARHGVRIEGGNAIINGGNYSVSVTAGMTHHALNVSGNSNVIIKGGTFAGPGKNTADDSGSAVNVQSGSTVTIEGGDFSGGKNKTLSNAGTLTISGGTFDQDPTEYVDENSADIIMIGDKWYVVTNDITVLAETAEELAAALKTDVQNINVVLANDIDVAITSLGQQTAGSGEYKLGGDQTETIEIDLNGKKLNITTGYWSAIGANNADATFTIKNGSMNSTGNSAGTWNAWDLRFSNCNYVFEGVNFEKAVALDNVGKSTLMKNVTITDTHNTDTYGLWITAEGQTVTLEDCVIDMTPATDGRGIKIDEQYVDTPAKVTLNVNNVTFKTEEKSAILVKSVAGAEINLSEININDVKEDAWNAVWVDEDAAAYADLVIVNGGLKKVEGQATVLNTENSTITLVNGVNYGTLTAGELKNVTIEGAEGTVMIFKTTADTKIENVTLKNVKFEYTGATADCGIVIDANAQIDNLVLEGCTFTGTGAKAGRGLSGLNNNASIEIKNCIFKDLGYPVYAWGSYKALTIEGCTFENIKSWAIMPQSGFDGDLTVIGCTFKDCLGGGLIKAGTLTAGHTFTFTNNVITGCTIAGDHNWFQFNVSAGTSVINGNTKDGAEWTPSSTDGLE